MTLKLEVFTALLETKIQCEREIGIKNGNLKYRNKWTSLCILDTRCNFYFLVNLLNLCSFRLPLCAFRLSCVNELYVKYGSLRKSLIVINDMHDVCKVLYFVYLFIYLFIYINLFCHNTIGHFRVHVCLLFKESLSGNSFL